MQISFSNKTGLITTERIEMTGENTSESLENQHSAAEQQTGDADRLEAHMRAAIS